MALMHFMALLPHRNDLGRLNGIFGFLSSSPITKIQAFFPTYLYKSIFLPYLLRKQSFFISLCLINTQTSVAI
ncbi:hypothetical protein GIB67_015687 [Kingdonia uniflora]|uniref:Uncharacterized protein n=1 Tax=Kingdonia uniflora TaxID=39325 RepID=A0A7J7NU45_9MAGN|nr:hypothetical protein GIB67_015687 [Kingdonia uniflora]